jgi:diacylglycerol kinase family enzyme
VLPGPSGQVGYPAEVRALLVVNPKATATTSRTRDVIAGALGRELKVDVAPTERRGHARELARRAVEDGFEVVVTLGGDGTVNEVVNGLLTDGPSPDLPALAVVPGGSTNVFARSLGLSRDPVEATGEILEALHLGRRRTLGLGAADSPEPDGKLPPPAWEGGSRWFTFCAGLGLDAEVVREVEVHRRKGRRSTPYLYVTTALNHFFTGTDRRHPVLTIRLPDGQEIDRVFFTIVSNSAPWTYLRGRAVQPTPLAEFDLGLDVFALRRLGTIGTLRVVRQILAQKGAGPRGRQVVTAHDLETVTVSSTRPLACQVDGEYVGEREQLVLRSVPDALRVVV